MNWREIEVNGNGEPWSEVQAMVNTLKQWVEEFTRHRGEEEPSILDLVFTKKPKLQTTIRYLSTMGKSDHVMLELEMKKMGIVKIQGKF